MRKVLTNLLRDESGATAIEYGLIAALISVVIIVAITAVGTQLSATFSTISSTSMRDAPSAIRTPGTPTLRPGRGRRTSAGASSGRSRPDRAR